jgi:NAD(P)-dependent dehydrogenase (short-subunit alcohol dehydrogenase family)
MDLGLAEKVVLVTGGSKGIGLACARAFLAEGARVAIASRNVENLQRAGEMLREARSRVVAVQADLTDPAAAREMVADVEGALGPIDVLVNSAGAAKRHAVESYDAEAWRQGMAAKYFPYVHALDAVRPGMIARRRGAIVNIIGAGGRRAVATHLSGGAANAALMLVTVGLAQALGPYGIRVNGINPGPVFTERVQHAAALEATTSGTTAAEIIERQQAGVPLGRFGWPEEVAAVAVFLASDRASYVHGAIVPMDGGAVPVI